VAGRKANWPSMVSSNAGKEIARHQMREVPDATALLLVETPRIPIELDKKIRIHAALGRFRGNGGW